MPKTTPEALADDLVWSEMEELTADEVDRIEASLGLGTTPSESDVRRLIFTIRHLKATRTTTYA